MKYKKLNTIYYPLIAVFCINIISKSIGFIRETLMASFYGTTEITDAFLMSNSIINIFFSILTAVSVLYIPLLSENLEGSKKQKERQTFQFIQIMVIISILIGGGVYLFRDNIIHLVASGFNEKALLLTKYFLFFAGFSFVLSTINQLLIFNLNYNGNFFSANLSTVILSATQIANVILSNITKDLLFLNISQTLGCLLQMFILIKLILPFKNKMEIIPINHEFIKKIAKLSIPIAMSTVIDDINVTIDKVFASKLEVGSVSALNYGHLLKQLLFFVLVSSIISVLYPKISIIIAKKDNIKLEKLIQVFLWFVEIITIPIILGSILYSKNIVYYVYERGIFDRQATIMTSEIFSMYIIGIFPLAIRELFQRILYSYQDTKETFKINAIMSLVNILLNVILFFPLKHRGLALSTSLSVYLVLPLYFYYISKKGIRFEMTLFVKEFYSVFLLSFFSIVPIYIIFRIIDITFITMIAAIISSIILYIILILIYKKNKLKSLLQFRNL